MHQETSKNCWETRTLKKLDDIIQKDTTENECKGTMQLHLRQSIYYVYLKLQIRKYYDRVQ